MARHQTDDEVDTSLLADKCQQATRHHRDDDKLAHADDAAAHSAEPSVEVVGASYQADDARQYNADGKHRHHVHAEDGRH